MKIIIVGVKTVETSGNAMVGYLDGRTDVYDSEKIVTLILNLSQIKYISISEK